MSASDGAQSSQIVPAGGSSSALSKTFEERSIIRSASSMIMILNLPIELPNCESATKARTSSIEMTTFSVDKTEMSGWVPA
jgi:hypothetical protein